MSSSEICGKLNARLSNAYVVSIETKYTPSNDCNYTIIVSLTNGSVIKAEGEDQSLAVFNLFEKVKSLM